MPSIGSTFADLGRIIVLDVETTGLDPARDRIVSIAMLKADISGEIIGKEAHVETFDAIINPGIPIPAASSRIHGITDSDVKDEGEFKTIMLSFLKFLNKFPIVAHNCDFDRKFVINEFKRYGYNFPASYPFYCTMKRFCNMQSLIGNRISRISLADACEYFEISLGRGKYHDARGDAIAALKLAAGLASLDRKYKL